MKTRLALLAILIVTALTFGACDKPKLATPVIESVASADGVPIRYETVGKTDAALVLVHCWTCNRNFWDAQVAHFAPRLQVVRLDLAGHGESGKARKEYTIPAFAGDVAAVVDKLGLKRVVLVGHSMGGPVALEAQKLLGDRVIGVVGVDTFHTGFKFPEDKNKFKQATDEFMKPFEDDFADAGKKFVRTMFAPSTDPAIVENISKSMGSADKDMAISALRGTFAWYQSDAQAAFARVGTRLRNINGDPKGGNKPLHESVVLIAGAAHFPAQEQPAAFNQALDSFVTQFVDAAPKQ
jgi:sigma-B regulation protein RsbQ